MKTKAQVRLLDEQAVRHRRLRLGLTETYLGSLCGVSLSVIRRLESGWPQDDLSARFITLLADRLGCTVGDLLADPHTEPHDDSEAEADAEADGGPDDCRQLGALLHAADRPVPHRRALPCAQMGPAPPARRHTRPRATARTRRCGDRRG